MDPPILVDWYCTFKHGKPYQGYIWEGIYQNYRDVPVSGEGFDSETWISTTYAYTEALLNNKSLGGTGEYAMLPLLTSLVRNNLGYLTILDFGGGMGIQYIHLTRSLPEVHVLQYHVVEGQRVCEPGSKLFAGNSRVHFCASLPKDLPQVDIVFIRSVLQYIDDYKGLLSQLVEYRPQFFLFVDLAAGKNPTYETAQNNVRGSVIPYQFINVREILELMAGLGYKLIFHGLQDRELDQSNFPEAYRLGHACNLLFARQLAVDE
jgi:putative methyltransferase (TIGR04325 family)